MKLALLSDAHGNAPALRACLAAAERCHPDTRYFLGDAVGYMPGGAEVIDALEAAGYLCQQGNHEAMLLRGGKRAEAEEEVYRLQAAAYDNGVRDRLQAWPTRRTLEVDGRRILLVHGSPDDALWGGVYPDTDLAPWDDLAYDAVFMAHTHRPFVTQRGETLFCNTGSTGLPRDQGDACSFVLYDSGDHAARVYRVPMPTEAVLDAYGEHIHPSVREVLERRTDPYPGEAAP